MADGAEGRLGPSRPLAPVGGCEANQKAVTVPACPSCAGTGHVCENHPDQPWGPMCCDAATGNEPCSHGACGCGAGEPCPACCPATLTSTIAEAFTPRFTEVR